MKKLVLFVVFVLFAMFICMCISEPDNPYFKGTPQNPKQKYYQGDIVYLKPDSIKCVIAFAGNGFVYVGISSKETALYYKRISAKLLY